MLAFAMNLAFSAITALFGAIMNAGMLQNAFWFLYSLITGEWGSLAFFSSLALGAVSFVTIASNWFFGRATPNPTHVNYNGGGGGSALGRLQTYWWGVMLAVLLVWLRWPITSTFMAIFTGLRVYAFGFPPLVFSWKLVAEAGVTWLLSVVLAHHTAQAIDACFKKVMAWVTALLLAVAYAPIWLLGKAGKAIARAAVRLFRTKVQADDQYETGVYDDSEAIPLAAKVADFFYSTLESLESFKNSFQGQGNDDEDSLHCMIEDFDSLSLQEQEDSDYEDDTHHGEQASSFHCMVEEYEGTFEVPTYDLMHRQENTCTEPRRRSPRSQPRQCYNEATLSKEGIDRRVQW